MPAGWSAPSGPDTTSIAKNWWIGFGSQELNALMDEAPEYHGVRRLHPESLAASADKLYWFLSGWLGGPPLYAQKIGNPMLRARHLPFPIGKAERDQWLACMRQALEDCGVEPPEFREWLLGQLFGTADWMRNKPGDMPGS